CVDRIGAMRKKLGKPRSDDERYMNLHHEKGFPQAALQVAGRLLRRNLPWTMEDLAFVVHRTADLEMVSIWCLPYLPPLVNVIEREAKTKSLTDQLRGGLERLGRSVERIASAPQRKLCAQLAKLAQ